VIAPPPPALATLPAGYHLKAGLGVSTVLPDLDFETFSEAGFVWDDARQKWTCLPGAPGQKKGIGIVGAAVYAAHPTTEILSLAYDLKDGLGRRRWIPRHYTASDPPPLDLFAHIAAGQLLEAHNSGFEHWIWNHVAVPKLGWPPLPIRQLRCSMAKARAHALPAALGNLADVLRLEIRKDKDGDRLLKKFSIPRDPTQKDKRRRIIPEEEPEDAERLYRYNETDIESEAEASSRIPDLDTDELEYWLCDQEINYRGVAVDAEAIADAITIVEQVFERYNGELARITGGAVVQGSQTEKLKEWLFTRGVQMSSMDEDAVEAALLDEWIPDDARRTLELRAKVGSASIKKLFTIRNQMSVWNRIHDLINYHAARTGRDGGKDAQTQNLPKAGPDVWCCRKCKRWFGDKPKIEPSCGWCGTTYLKAPNEKPREWNYLAAEDAVACIATRSLDFVEYVFGDAFLTIIGCLRAFIISGPGHDFIASDYSAIEAVVTAVLSGCAWRLEAFASGKDIYLVSIARITGRTYEWYIQYKRDNGNHHPDRQLGKILELALGYGGWIGSIISFGGDKFLTEDEMRVNILAWRAASPEIPEMWGGQFRGNPWRPATIYKEYFGLEGAAVQAILNPGTEFVFHAAHKDARPIKYVVRNDVLYCILPSGRPLAYHRPRLVPGGKGPWAQHGALSITFMGWNSNPKMGMMGWCQMETYGGKLAENVVQATARDILRDAVIRFRQTGYPVVLRVHDEIVAEVETGQGSIEEFESLMSIMPAWATGWPIVAKGGWRGHRYRKD